MINSKELGSNSAIPKSLDQPEQFQSPWNMQKGSNFVLQNTVVICISQFSGSFLDFG